MAAGGDCIDSRGGGSGIALVRIDEQYRERDRAGRGPADIDAPVCSLVAGVEPGTGMEPPRGLCSIRCRRYGNRTFSASPMVRRLVGRDCRALYDHRYGAGLAGDISDAVADTALAACSISFGVYGGLWRPTCGESRRRFSTHSVLAMASDGGRALREGVRFGGGRCGGAPPRSGSGRLA